LRKFSQYIAKIGGKWEWLFFPGYYKGFVFLARKYPPNVLLPSGHYYTEQTKPVTTAMLFGINPYNLLPGKTRDGNRAQQ